MKNYKAKTERFEEFMKSESFQSSNEAEQEMLAAILDVPMDDNRCRMLLNNALEIMHIDFMHEEALMYKWLSDITDCSAYSIPLFADMMVSEACTREDFIAIFIALYEEDRYKLIEELCQRDDGKRAMAKKNPFVVESSGNNTDANIWTNLLKVIVAQDPMTLLDSFADSDEDEKNSFLATIFCSQMATEEFIGILLEKADWRKLYIEHFVDFIDYRHERF